METERKGNQIEKRDEMIPKDKIGWLILPEEQDAFPEDVQAAARRVLEKPHLVEHLVEEVIRHLEEIPALYQRKRLS
jgi:hypothetical protein